MHEILHNTKTCNFTSGEDNCVSKICEFFLCASANLCSIKWRDGNSFHLVQKAEILVEVTFDRLLPGTKLAFQKIYLNKLC